MTPSPNTGYEAGHGGRGRKANDLRMKGRVVRLEEDSIGSGQRVTFDFGNGSAALFQLGDEVEIVVTRYPRR